MPGAKLARGIEASNSVIPPAGIRVDSEPSKCPAGFRSANRCRMQPDFHHGLLGIVRLRTVATVVLPSRGDIPRSGTRPVRRRSSPSGVTFESSGGVWVPTAPPRPAGSRNHTLGGVERHQNRNCATRRIQPALTKVTEIATRTDRVGRSLPDEEKPLPCPSRER